MNPIENDKDLRLACVRLAIDSDNPAQDIIETAQAIYEFVIAEKE